MKAYALGITDIDPIRHGLLFERFLNPERTSLPDIDIDFSMRGKDEVGSLFMDICRCISLYLRYVLSNTCRLFVI